MSIATNGCRQKQTAI